MQVYMAEEFLSIANLLLSTLLRKQEERLLLTKKTWREAPCKIGIVFRHGYASERENFFFKVTGNLPRVYPSFLTLPATVTSVAPTLRPGWFL